ncbi:MAG: hypothetical protein ACRDYA_11130 [Egibacteraceae bacterium]
MTRLLHSVAVAMSTFGLACGWLIAAAAPAVADVDWGLTSPGSETLIGESLNLAVFVEVPESEQVQGVAVRFLRDGWPFGETGMLSYRAGPLSAGRSDWGSRLNPNTSWVLGGQAMPNGLYDVQTRAKLFTSAGERWTEWRGHPIALQIPPPATALTVRSAGDGQTEVGWRQVQLPDFVRYDVERSADGVNWVVVASTARPDTTRITDSPPPGMWRYRTRVVRSDGQGGQLSTVSAAVEIVGLPVPAPRGGPPQPAAVGRAATDEASGTVVLPGAPSFPARSAASPEPPASRPGAPALPLPDDTYRRTLPYPKVGRQATQAQAAGGNEREPGPATTLVVQSRLRDRQLLLPVAGGLLLMITAAHVGLQLRR